MPPEPTYRDAFLGDVIDERQKQAKKGYTSVHDSRHSFAGWVAILTHELGCVADAALHGNREDFFRGLVKIAAVCLAACEG